MNKKQYAEAVAALEAADRKGLTIVKRARPRGGPQLLMIAERDWEKVLKDTDHRPFFIEFSRTIKQAAAIVAAAPLTRLERDTLKRWQYAKHDAQQARKKLQRRKAR